MSGIESSSYSPKYAILSLSKVLTIASTQVFLRVSFTSSIFLISQISCFCSFSRNEHFRAFSNRAQKSERQPERRLHQLSNSLAWARALAVYALVPARFLHGNNWDTTSCVCEKSSLRSALSDFVANTVMERSRFV